MVALKRNCGLPLLGLLMLIATGAAAETSWTQVTVHSGTFSSLRRSLEKVVPGENPENRIPTIVLHDPPGPGNSVAYKANYCPSEHRRDSGCVQGGVEYIELSTIHPDWRNEVDLGSPHTLTSLLHHVAVVYPSQHLLLSLKGRSAFGYLLVDDDRGERSVGLTAHELGQALQASRQSRGGSVDVVVLASSGSATIETAWSLAPQVQYLVATQRSVSQGRSAYFRVPVWAATMRDNPQTTPRELAKQIAWLYRDSSFGSFDPSVPYAISVIDLEVIPPIAERLSTDFKAILQLGDTGIEHLDVSAPELWGFGTKPSRVDLGALLGAFADYSATHQLAEPIGLRSGVALNSALVDNYDNSQDKLSGLSIFLPHNAQTQWDLRALYPARFGTFAQTSGWLKVLQARIDYLRAQASGCAGMQAQDTGVGVEHLLGFVFLLALRLRTRRF